MNQPPNPHESHELNEIRRDLPSTSVGPAKVPPDWRRGAGIAPGTWDYVHRPSIANGYDEFIANTPLCQWDRNRLAEIFPTWLDHSATPWIGDFGSGTGRASLDLASRGYRVLAIDLSESMLLQLIGKLPQSDQGSSTNPSSEDDPRILPLRMNLVDMAGLADQSLDHGVCLFATMGMIQGRQHRRAFLSHVTRLLRPGGQFVVHVHHRWAGLTEPGGWRRLLTSLIRRDQEIGDSVYAYRGIGDMFMHRYGRRELIADLKLSGFKQVTVDRINRTGDGLASRFSLAGGFMAVASV
jgi:SAM-dependent methyltransferase